MLFLYPIYSFDFSILICFSFFYSVTEASKILPRKVFKVKFFEEPENQVRFFIFGQEKQENWKIQKMQNFQILFFELKMGS